MIYSFTNLLCGTWMAGNQGSEKRMMWFLDCHLEGLTIQQVINEATGGFSVSKLLCPMISRLPCPTHYPRLP